MTRLAARANGPEQMDAADLDPATYGAILDDLAKVNRVTLAHRATLAFLARALAGRRSFRLLDVGFGDGDLLRAIARWAAARGLEAQLVGVDLNPRSAPHAAARTPAGVAIDWRTGDYAVQPDDLDIVVSSLVAHHMTRGELVAFLRWMEARARAGWMVNDLHRHRVAHLGFPLLARLARWHQIVREDGTLSIARGFRPAEWQTLLDEAGVTGARVVRRFPLRLCVERTR